MKGYPTERGAVMTESHRAKLVAAYMVVRNHPARRLVPKQPGCFVLESWKAGYLSQVPVRVRA